MGTFLWLMLLFPGLCDITSSLPRQFHVVKEEKTWTAAQQYCREKFTDLATIDDMADMEILTRIIQDEGVTQVWIGLKHGGSYKYLWSLADEDFYGENETDFRNWDHTDNQPNERSGENCVMTEDGGLWYDYFCSRLYPFICYDGRNSTHHYVLIEDKKSWPNAQKYCREHYTDLASVRNQAENDLIEAVRVKGPGENHPWIGLFRDAWQWSDGSSSSFRNWASGPGAFDGDLCAEVLSTGLWRGRSCSERKHFICYGASKEKVKQIVRVQLPVASGVNMEDPDVQEAFLQQIGQRLKDKGLPANTQVSWRKQADGKVFSKEKRKEVKKTHKINEL